MSPSAKKSAPEITDISEELSGAPRPLMTFRQLAEYLQAQGIPITASRIAKAKMIGNGPPIPAWLGRTPPDHPATGVRVGEIPPHTDARPPRAGPMSYDRAAAAAARVMAIVVQFAPFHQWTLEQQHRMHEAITAALRDELDEIRTELAGERRIED